MVHVGEPRGLVDRVAGPLQLLLLDRIGEPIVPPDAGQRNHRVALGGPGAIGGDEVRRRRGQQDGPRGELGAQRAHQMTAQFLHSGQRPVHDATEKWRGGRIRAKEARRRRHQYAVDHQVVQRYVVAAEPPAPHSPGTRIAEHPQVVQPRVAAAFSVEAGHEPLDVVEHVLQAHDRRHRDVPGGGQSGRDQSHRRPLLRGPLLVHGESAVVGRCVEPAAAFGVGRVVGGRSALRRAPLAGVEHLEPGVRRLGHPAGHLTAGREFVDRRRHLGHSAEPSSPRNP